ARMPSLGLRLARVATGALDGTFAAPNSHDWDLAAADLLVHEAGGLVTSLTGESLIYNRPDPVHGALVAAGRARHELLLGLIRDRLAEVAGSNRRGRRGGASRSQLMCRGGFEGGQGGPPRPRRVVVSGRGGRGRASNSW